MKNDEFSKRFSRIIPTGLQPQFARFLDGVLGQLSDGWGEDNPRKWDPYWRNMMVDEDNGQVVIRMDADPRSLCPLASKDDQEVREWFANNIKKTAKMTGLKWNRSNDQKIWGYFNYYRDPADSKWSVKEAYYAYEVLKGRNASKHPEYDSFATEEAEADEFAGEKYFL